MIPVQMDVTSRDDWEKVVQLAVRTWGAVDILVNCAGGTYKNKASQLSLVLLTSYSNKFLLLPVRENKQIKQKEIVTIY